MIENVTYAAERAVEAHYQDRKSSAQVLGRNIYTAAEYCTAETLEEMLAGRS
jgi:hypothetical protein